MTNSAADHFSREPIELARAENAAQDIVALLTLDRVSFRRRRTVGVLGEREPIDTKIIGVGDTQPDTAIRPVYFCRAEQSLGSASFRF